MDDGVRRRVGDAGMERDLDAGVIRLVPGPGLQQRVGEDPFERTSVGVDIRRPRTRRRRRRPVRRWSVRASLRRRRGAGSGIGVEGRTVVVRWTRPGPAAVTAPTLGTVAPRHVASGTKCGGVARRRQVRRRSEAAASSSEVRTSNCSEPSWSSTRRLWPMLWPLADRRRPAQLLQPSWCRSARPRGGTPPGRPRMNGCHQLLEVVVLALDEIARSWMSPRPAASNNSVRCPSRAPLSRDHRALRDRASGRRARARRLASVRRRDPTRRRRQRLPVGRPCPSRAAPLLGPS